MRSTKGAGLATVDATGGAGAPRAAAAVLHGRPPRRRDDRRAAWWFLLPVLLGFAVFYGYPAVRGAWYSVTDYTMLNQPTFVGAENYDKLLHDDQFWHSMLVTAWYVVLNIGSQTLLALGIAALMHRLTRSVVLRATLLLPWLVPNVTIGLLWMWLLDTNLGFVNHLLDSLGLGRVGFLTDATWAMPSIAAINTWSYTGYTALLLYAGMLQIPQHLYESAAIDGATEWRMFRGITLPLLRPVLALVLVVSLIGSFQIFDTVAVTTQGDPASATRVIYYYIYQQAFTYFHMGYASAAAVCLALVLGVLTAIQMRLLRASRSDLA